MVSFVFSLPTFSSAASSSSVLFLKLYHYCFFFSRSFTSLFFFLSTFCLNLIIDPSYYQINITFYTISIFSRAHTAFAISTLREREGKYSSQISNYTWKWTDALYLVVSTAAIRVCVDKWNKVKYYTNKEISYTCVYDRFICHFYLPPVAWVLGCPPDPRRSEPQARKEEGSIN